MMPKHKLEAALAAGTFAKAWAPDTPPSEMASIGPFVLTQYQPAQRLVFERNPRYWRQDERGVQLPYADRLTIEIVPDQDAELVRLQSGQIDFMQQALRAADIETLRPLEAQGKVQVAELGRQPRRRLVRLQPAAGQVGQGSARRVAARARSSARRSRTRSIARRLPTRSSSARRCPIHGPVTPGNPRWFWPSIPRYEFSRDKAKALLGEHRAEESRSRTNGSKTRRAPRRASPC